MDWALPLLAALIIAGVGGAALRIWLIRRWASGKTFRRRRVGWLYSVTVGAPFVLLLVWTAIENPDQLWFLALLTLVIVPVSILPWVAAFWYPEDERRKREPKGPSAQSK